MQNRSLQAAIGSALLILIGIGHPIITGKLYIETDLGNIHLPARFFYATQLAAGEPFLWFPYMFNGFHLHGEGQLSLFHPLQWLLYRFVPFTPAFSLEFVRNYVFALAGSYLLLRRFRLGPAACAFGALAAAFSGFYMLHFMHLNVVAIAAHLPWMLLCIDIGLRSARSRVRAFAYLGIAIGTASQLLYGHPQIAWLVLVAEVGFAWAVVAVRGGARRLPWLVAAQAVGLMLAGAQLLPQWESFLASNRADPGEGFAFTIALDPRNLVQLLSPYFFRHRVFGDTQPIEYALYAGALFPVLLSWLWLRRAELGRLRVAAAWLTGASILFLWMALGEAGLLFRLQALLPVIDHFRAPARYILLFHAACAGLLAIAWSDLEAGTRAGAVLPWRRLRALAVPFGLSCIAAGAGLVLGAGAPGPLGSPLAIAVGPALVGLATLLVVAAARGGRIALPAIVLFLAADLGAYGLSFMWRMPPTTLDAYVERSFAPAWTREHRVHFGVAAWTIREIRLSNGYVAMVPDRALPTDVYTPGAIPAATLIPALRVTGIGAAFGKPVPDPLPRVRLVARSDAREPDLGAQLARTDVARVGITEQAIGFAAGPPGRAMLRVDRPGHIVIETRSKGPRLLILAESHHPGWRVSIDGEPARVVRVYDDFMGCQIGGGEHHVVFDFAPRSVADGLRVSLVGAGLLPLLYLGVVLSERAERRSTV